MRIAFAISCTVLVLAACGSQQPESRPPQVADNEPATGEPVQPSILDMKHEFDPGATVGVTRSEPLLEKMPMGGETFEAPVTVGRYRRLVPAQKPAWYNEKAKPEATNADGDTIYVDWARKDVHTLMHYLALRTGLQIIVQGDVDLVFQNGLRMPNGQPTEEEAKKVIRDICEANGLEYIEDDGFIIIKQKSEAELANVVPAEIPGRFDVAFEDCEWVGAVMETAAIAEVSVFVPSMPPDGADAGDGKGAFPIEQKKVSFSAENATADYILREIARQADMDVQVEELPEGIAYFFKYRK